MGTTIEEIQALLLDRMKAQAEGGVKSYAQGNLQVTLESLIDLPEAYAKIATLSPSTGAHRATIGEVVDS